MTDLPGPEIKPARRSLLDQVSVVWLVPLAALLISFAIAWQNYASRGPLIEIAFTDAEGIRAGETELRFRDVPVGVVENVTFSPGLDSVLVAVRLDNEIAPYVDAASEFWVVRPRVTAQGVTGLSTVLGGVFIQGSWDTDAAGLHDSFRGLDTAPVARPDVPGLQIVLSSDTGEGLLQGTPILYRGVQVGAVSALELAGDGQTVLAEAFVEAPYDALISSSTRFWNASGFSFTLGPQGATLDVSSLAALVSGGVALENLVSGGEQVVPGTTFQLFAGRAEALSSVFADPDAGASVSVGFVFSGDVSGLSAGSPVELAGLRIGQVAGVTGVIDEEQFGDRRVRLLATAELDPSRVVIRDAATETAASPTAEEALDALDVLAEGGVRARLARGSILVGGLKIVLDEEPGAVPAAFDRGAEPFPIFPSTSAELPEVADTVEGLIGRVNDLPIEELLGGATTLLDNVNAMLGSEAVLAIPGEALGLVADMRALVGSEAIQQAPAEIGTLLAELGAAVTDVRDILGEFRDAGAATALTEALAAAAPAIATVDRVLAAAEPAMAELPVLVERLGAAAEDVAGLAATAAGLPLAELVDSAAATAEAARALVSSEALQQVPGELNTVLTEVADTLREVREAELVTRTGAAMQSAGTAADRLAAATDALPALVARIDAVAATIEALPLASTVSAAEATLTSAQALIGSEAVQSLPAELASVLAEATGTLGEVRQTGLVARTGAAVDEVGTAAEQLATATEGLPELVARIEAVAASIEALPLASTVAAAEATLTSAQTLLDAQGTQALPAELNAALSELRSVLSDLRASGLVAQANTTLAEAEQAATAIREATAGVPDVVAGLDELTRTANALPLERLTTEAADLAAAAEALLSAEGAEELPGTLTSALDEARIALVELREGGLIASANQTLASTRDAAAAVEQASASLPDLAARLDRLAAQAERTLAGYAEGAELTREAQSTLREVQAAARAVSALARQIERNPNSLIMGR